MRRLYHEHQERVTRAATTERRKSAIVPGEPARSAPPSGLDHHRARHPEVDRAVIRVDNGRHEGMRIVVLRGQKLVKLQVLDLGGDRSTGRTSRGQKMLDVVVIAPGHPITHVNRGDLRAENS